MPKFFVSAEVRGTHLLELQAPTLAAAKRKAGLCVIPGCASRYVAVLHAGDIRVKTRRAPQAVAEKVNADRRAMLKPRRSTAARRHAAR